MLRSQIHNYLEQTVQQHEKIGRYIAKEIENQSLESKLPLQGLYRLNKDENILFWWIVDQKGKIFFAKESSLINAFSGDYFPDIWKKQGLERETVAFFKAKKCGVFTTSLKYKKEQWSFWIGFSTKKIDLHKREAIFKTVIVSLVSSLFLGFILYFVLGYYLKPIGIIENRLKDIAEGEGDLTKRINLNKDNEFGKLGQLVDVIIANLQQMIKDIAVEITALSEASSILSLSSSNMNQNANDMRNSAQDITETTNRSSDFVKNISSSASEMSASVNSVASAIEELSTSVNEISKNCQNESKIAKNAHIIVKDAEEMMEILNTSSKEIGKVLEVISDIADQTRLLALNATIEAASAGESGRGFAVVATEVKALAQQTAQATSQIEKQIEDMQGSTRNSVKAIKRMSEVVEDVNEISQQIVSSVEEQSTTTSEIAHNVSGVGRSADEVAKNVKDMAESIGEISSSILHVGESAANTSSEADQTNNNAKKLNEIAISLKSMVNKFKV